MWLGRRRRSVRLWAVAVAFSASACQFPNYNVGRDAPNGGAGATTSVAGSASGGGPQTVDGGTSSGSAGTSAIAGAMTAGTAGTSAGGASAGGGTLPNAGTAAGGMLGDAGTGGASGDPKLLLEDDFEAGADQWLEVAGSPWSVTPDAGHAGQGYQLTPTFDDFYASAAKDGPWTDQIIEADVKVLAFGGTGTGDVVSLLGRFANTDNYYAAVLRPDGRAAIRARVAGSPPASIKTSAALGITIGTWYRLRFELVGSALRLSVDGKLAAEIDDSSLTRGTVALGGDNTAASFDNVRVTRP